MQVRTVLAAAALFAGSVLAAENIALSLAQFTDAEPVTGNHLQTSSLGTPTGLSGSVSCTTVIIRSNNLIWNAVPNATGYLVERAIGTTGTFVALSNPTGTSYDDGAVTSGTYKYRVSSTRSNWSSAASSEITLTQPSLCL